MNVAKTIGEGVALAWGVSWLAIGVLGAIGWLTERRERARLHELERRTEKLAADTRALVDEQRQANDETSARARRGVYDQCDYDRWAMQAGMYGGFEVWEAKMAREAAERQSRDLLGAGDEARRLDRLMNWSPERRWGPEGLR